MKKILFAALIALLPLSSFAATVLGVKAGIGSWTHKPSGSLTSSIGGIDTSVDLNDGLLLSSKSESYVYFAVEHPVPMVPNFKYVNTQLTHSGSGNVVVAFGTYAIGAPVETSFSLNQTDLIFYYEVLDNDLVSVDVGLTAKMIDSKTAVNVTDTATITSTIPMLYAAAEISLASDFAFVGEISTIGTGGNSISDITTKITYETDYMLGIEAGIRTQSVKVDVSGVAANITFSGIFAGLYYNF